MQYLGIDNGTKGYLCWHGDDDVRIAKIPRRKGRMAQRVIHLTRDRVRPDYDYPKLVKLLLSVKELAADQLVAVMEEPSMFISGGAKAGGGTHKSKAQSICDLHRACGLMTAACQQSGVPLYLIAPSTWKSKLKLLRTPKEYTLEYASALRPDLNFPAVDAADAFLIGLVAKRLNIGV